MWMSNLQNESHAIFCPLLYWVKRYWENAKRLNNFEIFFVWLKSQYSYTAILRLTGGFNSLDQIKQWPLTVGFCSGMYLFQRNQRSLDTKSSLLEHLHRLFYIAATLREDWEDLQLCSYKVTKLDFKYISNLFQIFFKCSQTFQIYLK